jgi:hypothetical protein
MRSAAVAEKDTKVFGSRDPFLCAGLNSVTPNRYLVRIAEGAVFQTKANLLSNKVTCEIVAVLADGYDPDHTFDEKVRYAEPNGVGEKCCLIAGKPIEDEMTLKDIKMFVAAVQGIDGRKVSGLASNYLIQDKDSCDAILAAWASTPKDHDTLSAYPALSYAVIFATEGELPDPAEADGDGDEVIKRATAEKILPAKTQLEDKARFWAEVRDLCKLLPIGLDYAERWKNSYLIMESFVQENKAKTKYYAKNDPRIASDALLAKTLSPADYAAYKAYRQIS